MLMDASSCSQVTGSRVGRGLAVLNKHTTQRPWLLLCSQFIAQTKLKRVLTIMLSQEHYFLILVPFALAFSRLPGCGLNHSPPCVYFRINDPTLPYKCLKWTLTHSLIKNLYNLKLKSQPFFFFYLTVCFGSSRITLLEFERPPTPGQACYKSQQLPRGGEWEREGKEPWQLSC